MNDSTKTSEFLELCTAANLTSAEAAKLLGLEQDEIDQLSRGSKVPVGMRQILVGEARVKTARAPLSPMKIPVGTTDQAEVTNGVSAQEKIRSIRQLAKWTHIDLASRIGASHFSVVRWERGDTEPSSEIMQSLDRIHTRLLEGTAPNSIACSTPFASRGVRKAKSLPLFKVRLKVTLADSPTTPIVERLKQDDIWGDTRLESVLRHHGTPAQTIKEPAASTISAGKNTYTYDAHTYHTKVPPQGIAEVLRQYLPEGGLILDPFAGSGMTGVAALTGGYDVILNELSPAASFISNRFTAQLGSAEFRAGISAVVDDLSELRRELYSTECRECGKETELEYTVWSYRVVCAACSHEFTLWDHCRQYGRTVRDHRILKEFPCPACGEVQRKSRLARTHAVPVMVGYKCCRRAQVEHEPSELDLARIASLTGRPPLADGFYPTTPLPDGVNLGQPKKHGLTSVERFYTPRSLAAMSHLWRNVHRIDDPEIAAFVGFTFTSLYRRVTRLSEYRFWGGSGNTAHFNVPYIFNEANVFTTFLRKARTIEDHLETTASHYAGRAVVRTGSATDLSFLPDDTVDLVFTDPPFGANINYSEMNILWESWLGQFTDNTSEAIINKVQGKAVSDYQRLMRESLSECHRVLRPGHWMLLVFMNSSESVWESLKSAIGDSGFSIERVDIFDKQHGTFKQYVSENTAGCDLLLHCKKAASRQKLATIELDGAELVREFLAQRPGPIPKLPYLHVNRDEEIDYRMLYSEYVATALIAGTAAIDFADFRLIATNWMTEDGTA